MGWEKEGYTREREREDAEKSMGRRGGREGQREGWDRRERQREA